MSRAKRLGSCLAVALAAACATNSAPGGFLVSPKEAAASPYGGWIELTVGDGRNERRVEGELLAVSGEGDSVWVLRDSAGGGGGALAVPTASVRRGKLTGYSSNAGEVVSWTLLGVLSTASNGLLLIVTAPLWIVTGTVAASGESIAPERRTPPLAWPELALFARFPQGLPPGLPLGALTPKP